VFNARNALILCALLPVRAKKRQPIKGFGAQAHQISSLRHSVLIKKRSLHCSSGRRTRARGFTLIEIMVVITILGILAALIVPRVVGRTDDARVAAARQDIASVMQALKLYRLDNGRYPTTEQGLRSLIEKPTGEPVPNNWKQGGYLERSALPKDPWGKEYQYLSPGLRGEIDVFSFGRDGQTGGEGPDADIGSWAI
jgi:general secretion pathway protein G